MLLQVVLQNESQENPDIAAISINVKEIIELLAQEEEVLPEQNTIKEYRIEIEYKYKNTIQDQKLIQKHKLKIKVLAAKSRAEELEKENGELAGNLAKREQELDLKHQEKEDLEANLARTKEKLETETQCHNETKLRLSEVETRAPGSLLPPLASPLAPLLPPPPPPMAPPPPAPPGAPPPPPMQGGGGSNASLPNTTEALRAAVKKCIPQPSNPLKSFNWSKLPECKV